MQRRILLAVFFGLLFGELAGLAEWLHLGFYVRGAGFQPLILLDALIVDGGIGLLVGLVVGLVWHALRHSEPAQPNAPPSDLVRDVWTPRQPQVRLVWRSYGQPAAPSSRASARLQTAARRGVVSQAPGAASRSAAVGAASSGAGSAGISRRAALRLGVAAASASALGLGALAWTTKVQRQDAATAAYASSLAGSGGPSQSHPNVVLVTLDTVRADQVGVYGHPFVKTPSLDKLASESARFDMHLIQEPQTNPSHATMFTGMYPPASGVKVHMVDKLPDNIETLAGLFGAAGYATAGLYSWMSFDDQYCGFQRGFQLYQNVAGDMPGMLDNAVLRRLAAEFRVAEEYLLAPKELSSRVGVQQEMEWQNKGRADVTTDAAIAQIQVMSNGPFFLWVHYFDPHYPYLPPAPYDEQYDPGYKGTLDFNIGTIQAIEQGKIEPSSEDVKRLMGLYQGEITFLDHHLGRLFAALDSSGLADKTVLAVTADHGESFGEHTTFKEDTDYFHPHDLYNAEQRTPLFLRWPGRIKPGTVVAAPSQAIDLFPSLLAAAGIKVPDQNQGRSLLTLLDGSDSGSSRAAYGSMPDYVFTSIGVPGWKLIRNNASNTVELYDLKSDPEETHEASKANAGVAKQLTTQLESWMKAMRIS